MAIPPPTPDAAQPPGFPQEWFASEETNPTDEIGLRFACTLCGNCCSGPAGYVIVSDDEAASLAARLGIDVAQFISQYTHISPEGRSLNEKTSPAGLDCVFLDRETIPGKAVCGVYEDRPIQCRTWPFWPSVVRSKTSWAAAKRTCPGIDKGPLHPVTQIRVQRDTFKI
ncbi:MAG: YkgJ family cysteine cluster protein [Pyrinomonadaceae bacterium]|nr:YkgJ family cysteine cluster protein [Phycisphaerales bacterium]